MDTPRANLTERIRALAEETEQSFPDVSGVLYALAGAMKLQIEEVLHEQCKAFAAKAMDWMDKQKR